MDTPDFFIQVRDLVRLFLVALYAPVCFVAFRFFIPRLLPTGKRLAIGMLVALAAVTLISLEVPHGSRFVRSLWNLNVEENIPSLLALTQMTLVAAVALAAAWLAKSSPRLHRLYLGGVGWLFLHLARREFYSFDDYEGWQLDFAMLGIVVALVTLLVAARLPRRERAWYFMLLCGLAMGAAGALALDLLPYDCAKQAEFLRGCLIPHPFEESLEMVGMWLALLALLGIFSKLAPRPPRWIRAFLYMTPALSVLLLLLPAIGSWLDYRLAAPKAAVAWQHEIDLHAYRLAESERQLDLRLYLAGETWESFSGAGASAHLVDQVEGMSLAGADAIVSRLDTWRSAIFDFRVKYRLDLRLQIPPDATLNRALYIVLTLWREIDGEYLGQRALESDLPLYGESGVILRELVLPDQSPTTAPAPIASFENGFALEAAQLPERARRGQSMPITFAWRSDAESDQDYTQFLHFYHDESGQWWGYDQAPLGARLPTRLWYAGLADSETWQVPLPADIESGSYSAYTGLYRQRDMQRLAIADAPANDYLGDGRILLGSLIVE